MFLLDAFYVCLIPESLSKKAMLKSRSAQLSGATLVTVSESDTHTQSSSDKTSSNWFDRMVVKRLVPDQMPNRLGGKYSLLLLMITPSLALTAIMGAVFQISNYLQFRFKWSLSRISYVGVIQGLSRLVTLTLLLPLIKRFSPSEPIASIHFDLKIVVMGLMVEALTMLLYGVTTIGEGFYVGRCLFFFFAFFALYCLLGDFFSVNENNENTHTPIDLTLTPPLSIFFFSSNSPILETTSPCRRSNWLDRYTVLPSSPWRFVPLRDT